MDIALHHFGSILIVFILLSTAVCAQIDPKMQIKPPSAEAQSLGSFSEIPVDLYTGTVNISIPVYTVTQNELQVPVSLSYHGGGIKVTDECGLVGLGWTLNASGVISRMVRGYPDELTGYQVAGYDGLNGLTCNSLNKFREFINVVKDIRYEGDPSLLYEPKGATEIALTRWMEQYGPLYDDGYFDTSPDNYVFSVQDISGAFSGTNVTNVQSNQGCRILHPNCNLYQIEDANGYIYTFGAVEQQLYPFKVGTGQGITDWNNVPEQTFRYNSAWWLTSIRSRAGDTIHFHYTSAKQLHFHPRFYGFTQCTIQDNQGRDQIKSSYFYPPESYLDTTYHQLLSEIESTLCRVRFHYSPSSDIRISPRLDSITIHSKADDNKVIERYRFAYSGSSNRAKLTSVVRQGTGDRQQRYQLDYYPNNSQPLLVVDDARRDHWGYYAPQSRGRFDKKQYFDIFPVALSDDRCSNRYACRSTATDNMLRSIVYPSGLVSTFEWEPHDFSRWSRLGQTAHQEDSYSVTPVRTVDIVDRFDLCGKKNQEELSFSKSLLDSQTITIDLSQYYYNEYTRNFLSTCVYDWEHDYTEAYRPKVIVSRDGTEIFTTFIDKTTYSRSITIPVARYGAGSYTFQLINLRGTLNDINKSDSCSYYADIFNDRESDYGKVHISVSQINYGSIVVGDKESTNVGGVRIKRISYTSGSSPLLTKEYRYIGTDGKSSGVLAYPPRYGTVYPYVYQVQMQGSADVSIIGTPNMLTLRSNGLPFTLNGGGHIEYARVEEAIVKSAGSGNDFRYPANLIEYCYATSADIGCSDIDDTEYGTLMPADMLQLTSQRHQRGHLIMKREYTDECKTTNYNYNIVESSNADCITGALFPIADYREVNRSYSDGKGGVVSPYKRFGIVKYRVIPYNKRLLSQTSTGDRTSEYHAYTYTNSSYSGALNADMPVTHTTVNAAGDTVTEHFTYIGTSNQVSRCVTTVRGRIVDAWRYDYDDAYRVTHKYIASIDEKNMPTSASSLSWQLTESYTYHPKYNKVIEYVDHIVNVTTAYLWSYRGSEMIAKIVNATYSQVSSAITREIDDLFAADSPNMSLLNVIENNLPQCQIYRMTYMPLVGIESYMDPKGYYVHYLYDDFGRLSDIYEPRGRGKRILQHFDYHLATD